MHSAFGNEVGVGDLQEVAIEAVGLPARPFASRGGSYLGKSRGNRRDHVLLDQDSHRETLTLTRRQLRQGQRQARCGLRNYGLEPFFMSSIIAANRLAIRGRPSLVM